MNANWANWLLVLALTIVVASIFRATWIAQQELLPRILWTTLFGAAVALLFWYGLWTKDHRDIDTAEVANTTKFQEAFIIDTYHDVNAATYRQGEVYTLMTSVLVANPNSPRPWPDELDDLVRRGILAPTRTAKKKAIHPNLPPDAVTIRNAFLTTKGKSLAEDLLYVRKHPELNVARPVN
jgi:hypothetical protein